MAAPTDSQYQGQIIARVAGDDPLDSAYLAERMPLIWRMYVGYEAVPGLRFAYALVEAIDLLMGYERKEDVNTSREGDRRVDLKQRWDALQQMRDNAEAQRIHLDALAAATQSAGGAIGIISRTTPIARTWTDQATSDTLDRFLRGDAFLAGEVFPCR